MEARTAAGLLRLETPSAAASCLKTPTAQTGKSLVNARLFKTIQNVNRDLEPTRRNNTHYYKLANH